MKNIFCNFADIMRYTDASETLAKEYMERYEGAKLATADDARIRFIVTKMIEEGKAKLTAKKPGRPCAVRPGMSGNRVNRTVTLDLNIVACVEKHCGINPQSHFIEDAIKFYSTFLDSGIKPRKALLNIEDVKRCLDDIEGVEVED